MKTIKAVCAIISITALLLPVAGCGKTSDEQTSSKQTSQPTEITRSTQAANPTQEVEATESVQASHKVKAAQSVPVIISRTEFESRFGRPLITEVEFGKRFTSIYGVAFKDFLANPAAVAKSITNLQGATATADLSEPTYHVLVPRVFVESVPTNSLAFLLGLKIGDEIVDCYCESPKDQSERPEWGEDSPIPDDVFRVIHGNRLRMPVGNIPLGDILKACSDHDCSLVVETQNGKVSARNEKVIRFREAMMSRCGFDPRSSHYGYWLPECNDLGAKLQTVFEMKAGLSKTQYDQTLRRLEGRRRDSISSISGAKVFEGISFGSLHSSIQRLAAGRAADAGASGMDNMLKQVFRSKELRPNCTFCIYRGDGIDALAFYENDSLLFCVEYLLGTGNGLLEPSLPSGLTKEDFSRCVATFERKYAGRGLLRGGMGAAAVSFIPRELTFSPVFAGDVLFYRSGTPGEWHDVILHEIPNWNWLLFLEYRRVFTSSFAFLNQEAPVFVQNNRMLRENDFAELEGEAAKKWTGNTNVPDMLMSWHVPNAEITVEDDRNILYCGRNYTGQLVRSRGGFVQLFGRSDFLLAELMNLTAMAINSEARERAFWDRYRQILGGPETSSERLGPERRIENARQLLEYINGR